MVYFRHYAKDSLKLKGEIIIIAIIRNGFGPLPCPWTFGYSLGVPLHLTFKQLLRRAPPWRSFEVCLVVITYSSRLKYPMIRQVACNVHECFVLQIVEASIWCRQNFTLVQRVAEVSMSRKDSDSNSSLLPVQLEDLFCFAFSGLMKAFACLNPTVHFHYLMCRSAVQILRLFFNRLSQISIISSGSILWLS